MSPEAIQTQDIERPSKDLIEALSHIGSATASGELFKLGIRDPQILGPLPQTPGKSICGPALTLQFMPKREDLHTSGEYQGPARQLHRHALYHTEYRTGNASTAHRRPCGRGVFYSVGCPLHRRDQPLRNSSKLSSKRHRVPHCFPVVRFVGQDRAGIDGRPADGSRRRSGTICCNRAGKGHTARIVDDLRRPSSRTPSTDYG